MTAAPPFSVRLPDEAATLALAAAWTPALHPPLTVYLHGDLGAGKTTFVRGLLRALGHSGTVKSPTYAVVESYAFSGFDLHHFDLYRFASPEEWQDAGLDDLAGTRSICLLEWPEKGAGFAPPADIGIRLNHAQAGRRAELYAHTEHGQKSLTAWIKNLPDAK